MSDVEVVTFSHRRCSNAALQAENDMLERFISRIDHLGLVSQGGGDNLGAVGSTQLEGGVSATQRQDI